VHALQLNINMLGPSHWLLARRDTHRYAHGAVLDDDNDGDGDADDALLDEQANPAPLEVFGHLTGLTALRELDLTTHVR
jgi:hypothetical protein